MSKKMQMGIIRGCVKIVLKTPNSKLKRRWHMVKVEEDPAEEDPVEEDPVEEDPVEEDPAEEDPAEEDPVEAQHVDK